MKLALSWRDWELLSVEIGVMRRLAADEPLVIGSSLEDATIADPTEPDTWVFGFGLAPDHDD